MQLRVLSGFFGFGMGLANAPLVIAVQASVGFSQRGVATASTMFFRNIGGTIGVGAMGVTLARALLAGTAHEGGASLVARILGAERRNVDPELLASVSGDLAVGLTRVMALIAALTVGCAILAWLFPNVAATDAKA